MEAGAKRAAFISADIEFALRSAPSNTSALLALLAKAQHYAAAAITHLATVDAEDPKAIRVIQNQLKCYDLIVVWLGELVKEGFEAGDYLDHLNRDDLEAAVLGTEEEHDNDD